MIKKGDGRDKKDENKSRGNTSWVMRHHGEFSVTACQTPSLSIHGFSLHLPSTYTYFL
jgi:hypothetical protein